MKAYGLLPLLTGFCAALPANAALPPNAQRAAEFRAILDDYAVAGAFPGDQAIARIEYLGPDRYRVASVRCVMEVRIVNRPMPRGMVGPRSFGIQAGRVACRPH